VNQNKEQIRIPQSEVMIQAKGIARGLLLGTILSAAGIFGIEQYKHTKTSRISEVANQTLEISKFRDAAKSIFRCYTDQSCDSIVRFRLSKEGSQFAKQQFELGNETEEGQAVALSYKFDTGEIQQFSDTIPKTKDDLTDILTTSVFVQNLFHYDDVVEASDESDLDYYKTFKELTNDGAGDCDDFDIANAVINSSRGHDMMLISYTSANILPTKTESDPGHSFSGIKIADPVKFYSDLMVKSTKISTSDIVSNLPVIVLHQQGEIQYVLGIDATGNNRLSKLDLDTNPVPWQDEAKLLGGKLDINSGEYIFSLLNEFSTDWLTKRLKKDRDTHAIHKTTMTVTEVTNHGKTIVGTDIRNPLETVSTTTLGKLAIELSGPK
jgi:hypothetical protein